MVRSVLLRLPVRSKESRMEDRVNFPLLGKVQTEGYRAKLLDNLKGSFPLGGKLPEGILELEVLCF